jgi:hypothetical protein
MAGDSRLARPDTYDNLLKFTTLLFMAWPVLNNFTLLVFFPDWGASRGKMLLEVEG